MRAFWGGSTEVDIRCKANRQDLAKALDLPKATRAKLIIAKLLATSLGGPEGILAPDAHVERESIWRGTKEALAVAKGRGLELGSSAVPSATGGQGTAEKLRSSQGRHTRRLLRMRGLRFLPGSGQFGAGPSWRVVCRCKQTDSLGYREPARWDLESCHPLRHTKSKMLV